VNQVVCGVCDASWAALMNGSGLCILCTRRACQSAGVYMQQQWLCLPAECLGSWSCGQLSSVLQLSSPRSKGPARDQMVSDPSWLAPQALSLTCWHARLQVGCGEWKRPKKSNPKFTGPWRAPLIDNPAYTVGSGCWRDLCSTSPPVDLCCSGELTVSMAS
jgi:hypothetical protein